MSSLAALQPRTVSLLKGKQRPFTAAEKALIKKVHGYMPAAQLLEVLNDRLEADMPSAEPYTMDQLHAEIGDAAGDGDDTQDWTSLRKLVANARKDGLLDRITRQVIDDFAVVYQLSAGQVLRLQDVLLRAKDGE